MLDVGKQEIPVGFRQILEGIVDVIGGRCSALGEFYQRKVLC